MSKRAIFLGGKRASGGVSNPTFGPTDAVDDWLFVGNDAGGSLTATPSAGAATIGSEAGEMLGEPGSSHTYAMMWPLPDAIVAATTIVSAELTFKTHSTGVDSGVELYVGHDKTRASTTAPAGASAANNKVDRDGGQTPSSGAPDDWDEVTESLVISPASGLAGVETSTSYTINVKNQIDRIKARSGWDAGGHSCTIFLSGPVADDGSDNWVGEGDDRTRVKTVADTADEPSLTIVYTN